jgi:hypothetical protein
LNLRVHHRPSGHQPYQLEALWLFRVDHSIRLPAFSSKAREALSQYIARLRLSLKKISIEENGEATVISFTSDNEIFKGKTETFPVMRFFLALTRHIPRAPARSSGVEEGATAGFSRGAALRSRSSLLCLCQERPLDLGEADRSGVRGRPVALPSVFRSDADPCGDHRTGGGL